MRWCPQQSPHSPRAHYTANRKWKTTNGWQGEPWREMKGGRVADCKICSAVHKDVSLFLTGTTEEYVQEVARYRNESVILKNAESLKECIDGKMTEDDKKNAVNVLSKIHASPLC
ncbi:major allergen I polypeptide chain 1 isoform X1 [Ailuropoda melanoleuca]|uniref:major allergen I polypeptide chain 1 isoform X1 n=1 Tax=Ailuropoda melanoleuca TaxID=9646 RepID=UPI0009483546|nr:major allergen I polypeptide chain 1 isoform X1 [Ailuropoda melanoleuca]